MHHPIASLFSKDFPEFASQLRMGKGQPIEEVKSGLSNEELLLLEATHKITFPESFKRFLSLCGGIWLSGGTIQLGWSNIFRHPNRMLCFGEYSLEADGDQVLFDISSGLIRREYRVYYYDHEHRPPRYVKLADSFRGFIENLLQNRRVKDEST